MTITVSYLLNLAKRFGKSVCFIGGCIKNKLFDTLFLYIAIESAKIFKRPIFGDFPKIFDSRGV